MTIEIHRNKRRRESIPAPVYHLPGRFERLPSVLVLRAFEWLDLRSVCRLNCTCTALKKDALGSWIKLQSNACHYDLVDMARSLYQGRTSTASVESLLSIATTQSDRLQRLSLHRLPLPIGHLFSKTCFPKVTHLSLGNHGLPADMSKVRRHFPALTALQVNMKRIPSFKQFLKLQALQQLELRHVNCATIAESFAAEVKEGTPRVTELRIHLEGGLVSQVDATIVKLMASQVPLTALQLGPASLRSASPRLGHDALGALGNCATLTAVDLRACRVGYAGMVLISRIPNLQTLYLYRCYDLENRALTPLALCKPLRRLGFEACETQRLAQEGPKQMVQSLRQLKQLTHLAVSDSLSTVGDVAQLSTHLSTLQAFQVSLKFKAESIDDRVLEAVIKHCGANRPLVLRINAPHHAAARQWVATHYPALPLRVLPITMTPADIQFDPT